MKISDSQHRLRELIDAFGITSADIVARTGIDKSTISLYLNGKREPRQDKIAIISDAYNIDPAWLMGYDVPMERKKYPVPNSEDAKELAELTLKFSRLSPSGKKKLLFSADLIYQMECCDKVQSDNQELNEEFLHNMTG